MDRKSVIVVESDVEVGRAVFAACTDLGFDVRVFHDALDALMVAARSKPDLMVFDADNSVLGSLDFADVVSRDPQFKAVVLIAIVGEMDAVAFRRYSARGFAVVTKGDHDSRVLGKQLSSLLKPHAAFESSRGRDRRRANRAKGAA
jgi:CheY-like chemotaxis protein